MSRGNHIGLNAGFVFPKNFQQPLLIPKLGGERDLLDQLHGLLDIAVQHLGLSLQSSHSAVNLRRFPVHTDNRLDSAGYQIDFREQIPIAVLCGIHLTDTTV